ncbi:hypothetical protein EMPS_04527 [Entomortierella parvispora]|uniref:Uncharacterized protein n=1 Tax=Entomortierella parvispora TaxID=205924 RepID=A0A9P3H8V1_9FUNG|nr:hypothetical protein EMPS_04527 [Entomortierella parvispora]
MAPTRRFIVTCSHHCHCNSHNNDSSVVVEKAILKLSSEPLQTSTKKIDFSPLPTPPCSPELGPMSSLDTVPTSASTNDTLSTPLDDSSVEDDGAFLCFPTVPQH